jgi:hypothetical protein
MPISPSQPEDLHTEMEVEMASSRTIVIAKFQLCAVQGSPCQILIFDKWVDKVINALGLEVEDADSDLYSFGSDLFPAKISALDGLSGSRGTMAKNPLSKRPQSPGRESVH